MVYFKDLFQIMALRILSVVERRWVRKIIILNEYENVLKRILFKEV